MRVIGGDNLRDFWRRHPDARRPLEAWLGEVERADWATPVHLRDRYPYASIISDDKVVFNVKGNRYRLVARVNYRRRMLWVRFVGTHAEYDRIDAREV